MGRLSGFSYREVARRLRVLGFELERQGKGSHEQWFNPADRRRVTVPRHARDFKEGTLRGVLKQAAVDVEDFLKA